MRESGHEIPEALIAKLVRLPKPATVRGIASSRSTGNLGELPNISVDRQNELLKAIGAEPITTQSDEPADEPSAELVRLSDVEAIDWDKVAVTVTADGENVPAFHAIPVVELFRTLDSVTTQLTEADRENARLERQHGDIIRSLEADAAADKARLQAKLDEALADAAQAKLERDLARGEAGQYRAIAAIEMNRNGVRV